jgi:hypothetical protein
VPLVPKVRPTCTSMVLSPSLHLQLAQKSEGVILSSGFASFGVPGGAGTPTPLHIS